MNTRACCHWDRKFIRTWPIALCCNHTTGRGLDLSSFDCRHLRHLMLMQKLLWNCLRSHCLSLQESQTCSQDGHPHGVSVFPQHDSHACPGKHVSGGRVCGARVSSSCSSLQTTGSGTTPADHTFLGLLFASRWHAFLARLLCYSDRLNILMSSISPSTHHSSGTPRQSHKPVQRLLLPPHVPHGG